MVDAEVKDYIDERMRVVEAQYDNLKTLLEAFRSEMNGQFNAMNGQFNASRDQLQTYRNGTNDQLQVVRDTIQTVRDQYSGLEKKVDANAASLHQLSLQQREMLYGIQTIQEKLKIKRIGFHGGSAPPA